MEAKILDLAAKLGAARNKYEELRQQLQNSYDFTHSRYLEDPEDLIKQLGQLSELMAEHNVAFNELISEYAKIVYAELDAIDAQETANATPATRSNVDVSRLASILD